MLIIFFVNITSRKILIDDTSGDDIYSSKIHISDLYLAIIRYLLYDSDMTVGLMTSSSRSEDSDSSLFGDFTDWHSSFFGIGISIFCITSEETLTTTRKQIRPTRSSIVSTLTSYETTSSKSLLTTSRQDSTQTHIDIIIDKLDKFTYSIFSRLTRQC